jgi:predicted kinase
VLLNGPPASGKSTIATLLVRTRLLALNLDIDMVRGQLGAWVDAPADAGLAARKLALAMIATHLAQGLDVVVPQFLAREKFIDELQAAASQAGAEFVEFAFLISRVDMLRAFEQRSHSPENQQHRDAHVLVQLGGGTDTLEDMHARFMSLMASRHNVHRIDVVRGDVDGTLRRVESVL